MLQVQLLIFWLAYLQVYCVDSYNHSYIHSYMHRHNDFLKGGDFTTGDGRGGESIYGSKFAVS